MLTNLGSVRLAVVGTGLIGASVGLAAKRAGAPTVAGYDADPDALAVAVERGAVDRPMASLENAVADADMVVVATPVALIPMHLAEVLDAANPSCTVTDVGSTKAGICAALSGESRFVGGHPLSGSEAHGPGSAHAEMFDGSTWFLTPLPETDLERYRLLGGFVRSLGAEPVEIDPIAHDQLVALTSHLPHALANVLVNQAGAEPVAGRDALALAGPSFRDMTRMAGANPQLWVDIFLDNAESIGVALAGHRRRVGELEDVLRRGDVEALTTWIEEAARNRHRLTGD